MTYKQYIDSFSFSQLTIDVLMFITQHITYAIYHQTYSSMIKQEEESVLPDNEVEINNEYESPSHFKGEEYEPFLNRDLDNNQ